MLGRALDRVQLPSSRAAFIAASRSWSPRLRSFIDLATTIPSIQRAAMAGWVGHKPAPPKFILGTDYNRRAQSERRDQRRVRDQSDRLGFHIAVHGFEFRSCDGERDFTGRLPDFSGTGANDHVRRF